MGVRSELKLIEQAIKNGWPLKPESIAEGIRLCESVLNDSESTEREMLRAIRTKQLLEERQNNG